jgi:hypothetical protein
MRSIFYLIGTSACTELSGVEWETVCEIFKQADQTLDLVEGRVSELLERGGPGVNKPFAHQVEEMLSERDKLQEKTLTGTMVNYCSCFRVLMGTILKASLELKPESEAVRGLVYNLDGVRRRLEELSLIENQRSPDHAYVQTLLDTFELVAFRILASAEQLNHIAQSDKVSQLISKLYALTEEARKQTVNLRKNESVQGIACVLAVRVKVLLKFMKSFEHLEENPETGEDSLLWITGIVMAIPEVESLLREIEEIANPQSLTADSFLAEWRALHCEFPDLAPPPSVDLQFTMTL